MRDIDYKYIVVDTEHVTTINDKDTTVETLYNLFDIPLENKNADSLNKKIGEIPNCSCTYEKSTLVHKDDTADNTPILAPYSRTGIKLEIGTVTNEQKIIMHKYKKTDTIKPVQAFKFNGNDYKIRSIICHQGNASNNGHYLTYIIHKIDSEIYIANTGKIEQYNKTFDELLDKIDIYCCIYTTDYDYKYKEMTQMTEILVYPQYNCTCYMVASFAALFVSIQWYDLINDYFMKKYKITKITDIDLSSTSKIRIGETTYNLQETLVRDIASQMEPDRVITTDSQLDSNEFIQKLFGIIDESDGSVMHNKKFKASNYYAELKCDPDECMFDSSQTGKTNLKEDRPGASYIIPPHTLQTNSKLNTIEGGGSVLQILTNASIVGNDVDGNDVDDNDAVDNDAVDNDVDGNYIRYKIFIDLLKTYTDIYTGPNAPTIAITRPNFDELFGLITSNFLDISILNLIGLGRETFIYGIIYYGFEFSKIKFNAFNIYVEIDAGSFNWSDFTLTTEKRTINIGGHEYEITHINQGNITQWVFDVNSVDNIIKKKYKIRILIPVNDNNITNKDYITNFIANIKIKNTSSPTREYELKTIQNKIKLLGFIYNGHNVKFIYGEKSNDKPSITFDDSEKITIKLPGDNTKTHYKPDMSHERIEDIFRVVYSYLCIPHNTFSGDIIFSLSDGDKCINIISSDDVGAGTLLTNIQGKGGNGKYLTVADVKVKLDNNDDTVYGMLIDGDTKELINKTANIYEITKDKVTTPSNIPDTAPAPAPAPDPGPGDGAVNTDISGIISKIRMEHNDNYTRALGEITNCKKATHWVWYIFPEPPSPYHSTDEAKDNELGYDMVEEYLLSDTECADKQTLLKHYANILTALWRCLWSKNINEILPNSEDKSKVKASVIMFTNTAENLLKRPKIVGSSKHGDLTIIKETGILILRSFINIDEPLYYRIYIGKKNQIRLHIQTGNLLDLNLNYIVNAANRSGIANGNTKGIDREFYKRGGDELIQALKNKMSGNVTLPGGIMLPGSTMFTPRKYGSIKAIDGIIHAVGPESTKRFIKKHTDALNNAYMGSFSHCKDDIKNTKKKNVSIGFPVLLGGEFAHIDDNIQIAVTTGLNSIVKYFDSTEDDGISDVYFVISDPGKNKDRAEYILQRHECTTWFKKCTDDTKWFGPKQK